MGRSYKTSYKQLHDLSDEIVLGAVGPFEESAGEEGFYVIMPEHFNGDGTLRLDQKKYNFSEQNKELFIKAIVRTGDVLVCLKGDTLEAVVFELENLKIVALEYVVIIRTKANQLITSFINSQVGKKYILSQNVINRRSVVYPKIDIETLSKLNIPVYPSDDLNAIVRKLRPREAFIESEVVNALIKELENVGWEVKKEFRVNGLVLDIALFDYNRLQAFIELKENHQVNFDKDTHLKRQLDEYLFKSKSTKAFLFVDGTFSEYSDGRLKVVKDIPRPIDHKFSIVKEDAINYGLQFSPDIAVFFYIEEILKRLSKIEKGVNEVKGKIDNLTALVKGLRDDFSCLKNYNRTVEEKIDLMTDVLDKRLAVMQKDAGFEIEKYENMLRKFFNPEWDKFDKLSKVYLPMAEMLKDQLENMKDGDMSPFVLQYCRAVENEMLQKMFRAYVQNLIDRKVDLRSEFQWDFEKNENGKPNDENTSRFIKVIEKYIQKEKPNEWFFELGTMFFILELIKGGGKTLKKSPLLQDIRKFLLENFQATMFEYDFIDKGKGISLEFRNKAAHPNIIDKESGESARKEIKEYLKRMMEMYK
jgi:hypothetical protein